MPQQNRPIPGSASDWLARAKGDLILAKGPLQEGAFLEDLCFHAQQAVEKAIKAFYVYHGLVFRYTHDLDEILELLLTYAIPRRDTKPIAKALLRKHKSLTSVLDQPTE